MSTAGSAQWLGTAITSAVDALPAVYRAKGAVDVSTSSPQTRVATTEATGLTPVPTGGGMTSRRMVTVIRPSSRTRTRLGPFTQGAPPGLILAIAGLAGAGMLPTSLARRRL